MATGFVKAKCAKCKNEQMIFGKPATEVKCLVCGEVLAKPSGGRGVMSAPKAEDKPAIERAVSDSRGIGTHRVPRELGCASAARPERAASAARPERAASAAKSPAAEKKAKAGSG